MFEASQGWQLVCSIMVSYWGHFQTNGARKYCPAAGQIDTPQNMQISALRTDWNHKHSMLQQFQSPSSSPSIYSMLTPTIRRIELGIERFHQKAPSLKPETDFRLQEQYHHHHCFSKHIPQVTHCALVINKLAFQSMSVVVPVECLPILTHAHFLAHFSNKINGGCLIENPKWPLRQAENRSHLCSQLAKRLSTSYMSLAQYLF